MALVTLEARIENIFPICGEHLVGTFTCGGGDGPHASISQTVVKTLAWAVDVQGQAEIVTLLLPSTSLSASVEGKASLAPPLGINRVLSVGVGGKAEILSLLTEQLNLGIEVEGRAKLKARLILRWIEATTPVDLLLQPTDEEDPVYAMIPSAEESWLLVSTADESRTLDPVEEEEWVLVPTGSRGP